MLRSPFSGDFGQELSFKVWYAFVILRTKGENWDSTDFEVGVGTGCLEYTEETLKSVQLTFSHLISTSVRRATFRRAWIISVLFVSNKLDLGVGFHNLMNNLKPLTFRVKVANY